MYPIEQKACEVKHHTIRSETKQAEHTTQENNNNTKQGYTLKNAAQQFEQQRQDTYSQRQTRFGEEHNEQEENHHSEKFGPKEEGKRIIYYAA
eukprot:274296-Heterocapsa_arctica.AAC.1